MHHTPSPARLATVALFVLVLALASALSACSGSGASTDTPDGDDEAVPDGDTDGDGDGDGDTSDPDGDTDDEAEPDGDNETDLDGDAESEEDDESSVEEGFPPRPDFAPSLLLKPEDKARILARADQPPWSDILAQLDEMAAREYVPQEEGVLDSTEQPNGAIALAAAFLAWLRDDVELAEKTRLFLDRLSDNYDGHKDGDINIRLPGIVMNYVFAVDFLVGAGLIPDEEVSRAENKFTAIIDAFYDDYILNPLNRAFIRLTQNNHPIRTACSIATVAMAYPEHPRAEEWADWALAELAYLWGPTGHYVQEDGGVSEGSLYYRFAFAPSLALFLAWENRVGEPRLFHKNCINRIDKGPWVDHGCVEGDPFVFHNPLHEEPFQRSVDWFTTIRMPGGGGPPIEDSGIRTANGSAIMARFMDRPDFVWAWADGGYNVSGGFDLHIPHLAYVPDQLDASPPAWKHRVMPIAGQAVFRSGWQADDIWLLMTAEHGSARLTVHDHVDAGSFTLAAYGEYLLIDTGYYKPVMSNNARTAQAASHNLLMIEGEPVPPKGLLLSFGDADAFLKNDYLGDSLAYVEAWQTIEQSTTQRGMALVRDRYAVIFDRIDTTVAEARLHTWRLHGFAGLDSGGVFEITPAKTRWERPKAGVDVYLASSAPDLECVEPPFAENQAPHVHEIISGPGHHGVMDGRVTSVSPRFVAAAVPYRVGAEAGDPEAPLDVLPLPDLPAGVAGFEIRTDAHTDVILARDPQAPETLEISEDLTIETDAEWLLVGRGATPLYLAARGTYLRVNGADIFQNITEDVAVQEGHEGEKRK